MESKPAPHLGMLPSLDALGVANRTDKSSLKHHYLDRYESALKHLRLQPVRLLEIGIFKGASLRTWRDYFVNGRIVGVDYDPETLRHAGDRIETHLGDQNDPAGLAAFTKAHGPFDIIVDDGSHIWRHQIATLRALLPLVKSGGFYILEDLHTSFGDHGPVYGEGGGETGAAYVLRLAERLLGAGVQRAPDETDIIMSRASDLILSLQICGRTAIFQRR